MGEGARLFNLGLKEGELNRNGGGGGGLFQLIQNLIFQENNKLVMSLQCHLYPNSMIHQGFKDQVQYKVTEM